MSWSKDKASKWHQENKVSQKEKARLRALPKQEYVLQYLLEHPCKNCGESDPVVLQFHHRDPNTKEGIASKFIHYSWEKLKAEIEKCDILCANCHIKHHAQELDTWRMKLKRAS